MSELKDVLGLSFFESLTEDTRHLMYAMVNLETVSADTFIFEQGQPPSRFCILLKGYVTLFRQSRQKSQILALVAANQTFGGETIANGMVCPYTAKTISTARIATIEPSGIQELLHCPDFLAIYLELVSRRIRQLTTLVHRLAFHDVASRVAGVLLMLAEVNSEVTAEGLRVPRLLSQNDFAAMVGTAREVIYRTMKQFETDGLIRATRRDYYLLDINTLTAIASQENK